MRLLLDTHAFLWLVNDDSRLGPLTRHVVLDLDNTVYLSVGSLWEIAIKTSLGKLHLALTLEQLIAEQLALTSIELLPISLAELSVVARLPFYHRDPFDRLLVAQAITHEMPLVSADFVLDQYGIQRLWDHR